MTKDYLNQQQQQILTKYQKYKQKPTKKKTNKQTSKTIRTTKIESQVLPKFFASDALTIYKQITNKLERKQIE